MAIYLYRLQFTQSFLFFRRNSSLLLQIDLKLLKNTDFLLLIIAHHRFSFCYIIRLLPLFNTNEYR